MYAQMSEKLLRAAQECLALCCIYAQTVLKVFRTAQNDSELLKLLNPTQYCSELVITDQRLLKLVQIVKPAQNYSRLLKLQMYPELLKATQTSILLLLFKDA